MSGGRPRISIIIAARPDQTEPSALASVTPLLDEIEGGEVLIARGTQPSRQRNVAAKEAVGEVLYFLDDDSVPVANNLARIRDAFEDQTLAVLGGPNLCPQTALLIEQIFASVLGSWLAFGPSAARYLRKGTRRPSSEKELILCNMAIRREDFLSLGGFDEALYPNEENALLDAVATAGRQIFYDPDLIVYRHPRATLVEFGRMLYRYGRGRGEQVRRHPTWGSALNFIPAFFTLYVGGLCFIEFLPGPWRGVFLGPLGAYLLVLLGVTGVGLHLFGTVIGVLRVPLIPFAHVAYGLGLWKGLVAGARGKFDPTVERTIRVEHVV